MAEDKFYLTVGNDPKGRGLLAIMSRGQPQLGDKHSEILTLEIVKNMDEARAWCLRMEIERPWEQRN